MTHLDEGRLQALLDDEMTEAAAREARAHLEGCAPCRSLLEAMRARSAAVARALLALDVTPPTAPVKERVRAEARRRRPARRWLGVPVTALPRAAAITLLVAGGAAAAVLPGSPLRSWISGDDEVSQVRETPAAAVSAAPEEVGIRVAPSDGRVRVVVEGLPTGAEVEVTLADGIAGAGAFAPDGARFRSGEGVLEVTTPRGPVRVELPRGVAASVSVEGRIYLESDASGLRTPGPAVERDTDRVLFRVN